MLPEISELLRKRKKFGFTQSELATKTSVSQSLIAKIEAGDIVPSYSNAKKLFDFFDSLSEQTESKARDFMSTKVIGVKSDITLKAAVKIMKKSAVSQLPVIDEGKTIGTISEKIILEKMNSAKDLNEVSSIMVASIMVEAMPTVKEGTPFKAVSALLEYNPGVLVVTKGKIIGIITKSDLLNAVLSKKSASGREISGEI